MNVLSLFRRYSWYRSSLFAWQRLTRGWDDSETWSLDHTIAKWALPRLRRFRELSHGYPGTMTPEEWERVLGEIEWFLTVHAEGVWNMGGHAFDRNYHSERYAEAARLFGEHFGDLWS